MIPTDETLEIGDQVRLTGYMWRSGYPGVEVGSIVTVERFENGNPWGTDCGSLAQDGMMYEGYEWELVKGSTMAKMIAEFQQGPRPSSTTDSMRIAQSSTDPEGIYIQLIKGRTETNAPKIMHFKIDNIDDILVALQYAKFLQDQTKE